MEAGNWDAAVKAFGQALDNARGDVCVKEAQYLAAVMLLRVRHQPLQNPLPMLHAVTDSSVQGHSTCCCVQSASHYAACRHAAVQLFSV